MDLSMVNDIFHFIHCTFVHFEILISVKYARRQVVECQKSKSCYLSKIDLGLSEHLCSYLSMSPHRCFTVIPDWIIYALIFEYAWMSASCFAGDHINQPYKSIKLWTRVVTVLDTRNNHGFCFTFSLRLISSALFHRSDCWCPSFITI